MLKCTHAASLIIYFPTITCSHANTQTMMARTLVRLSAFFAVAATVSATLEKGIVEVEEVG